MKHIIHYLVIMLSLTTATGVLLHDARIDKAAWTSLSSKHMQATRVTNARSDAGIAVDAHTHPQHAGKTLHGFSYHSPSIHPRERRESHSIEQLLRSTGRHAFDHSYLPVVA